MRKFLTCLIILFIFLGFSQKAKAIEEQKGYVGMNMYKFNQPKVLKEVVIFNVFPNSPAWNAGVKIGDRVLKVNNIDVTNHSVEEIQKLVIGKPNEDVNITFKTREGIKEYKMKRAPLNLTNAAPYPRWVDYCGDKSSNHEACFIHANESINKINQDRKTQKIIRKGINIAYKRYEFEDNLNLCSKSSDPAMCYLQLKQNIINNAQAEQMRRIQVIQAVNQINNGFELQNINKNLNNINNSLWRLKY